MAKMLVQDLMMESPPTVQSSTPLDEAVQKLIKYDLIGIPVVDEKRQVVGFLSEQDCIRTMLVASYYCDDPTSVSEVMSTNLATVAPHDSIMDIAEQMGKERPKCYPVVQDGKLVGLLTRKHVLKGLSANLGGCKV